MWVSIQERQQQRQAQEAADDVLVYAVRLCRELTLAGIPAQCGFNRGGAFFVALSRRIERDKEGVAIDIAHDATLWLDGMVRLMAAHPNPADALGEIEAMFR